jgi:hypothetical protein
MDCSDRGHAVVHRIQGCGARMPPTAGSPWVQRSTVPRHRRSLHDHLRPTHGSLAPCSEPSRCGLASVSFVVSQQRRPALTAPARGAGIAMRVGTKKRSPDRTKKLQGSKESKKGRNTVLDKKPHTRVCKGGPGALLLSRAWSAFAHADSADRVGKGGRHAVRDRDVGAAFAHPTVPPKSDSLIVESLFKALLRTHP